MVEGNEKRLDSEYTVGVEPLRFKYGSGVGCEKKKTQRWWHQGVNMSPGVSGSVIYGGRRKMKGVMGLGKGNQELSFRSILILLLWQIASETYHLSILKCAAQWHEVYAQCCDPHCHPFLELFHYLKQKLCTHSTPHLTPTPTRLWSSLFCLLSNGYVYLRCLLDIQGKILEST